MMAWYSRERSSFKSSARRSRETSVSAALDFGSGIFFLLLRKTGIHSRKILSYYHGTYHPTVAQFGISDSPLEGVIPKAGAFQPAEGSCVGYPCLTAREIPHYA